MVESRQGRSLVLRYRSTRLHPTYEDWLNSDVRRKLVILLSDMTVLQNARVYLIRNNLVNGPRELTGYYDFVRKVFHHIRKNDYAAAVPLIEADLLQFKEWGFSGPVLCSLALLQGVNVKA